MVRFIGDDNEQQQAIQRYGGPSNITAYTTALGARISMPAQLVKVDLAYNRSISLTP